jgi:ATP-dependent DNA helicase RecG
LPEPDIEKNSGGISVTIYKNVYSEKQLKEKGLSKRQVKVIEFLRENSFISNKIYQEMFKVSKATATRDLTDLVDKFKLIERYGDVGAGTTYKLIGS